MASLVMTPPESVPSYSGLENVGTFTTFSSGFEKTVILTVFDLGLSAKES